METEGLSEEEMIDSLFYRCDVHDEGRVQISTIIQFLKNCLGNGNNCLENIQDRLSQDVAHLQNEPDLVKLATILEEKSNEGNINFAAYRSGVKHWIAEIRQRCKSTSFLESDSLIMGGDNGDLINSTDQIDELLSGCIETSGIGDGPNRNEQDIGDLLGQLEDSKFQNRKLVEENAKLHYQLESQEETSSALASDIQNRRQEEEQLKKKVKSLQEIVELRQSVIEENEELKNKMTRLKERKKELENKVISLERDNMNLENQTRSLENKWQRSQQELEVARKELQELQNTCTEQKDLLFQTQEQKNSKDILLTEKSTELAALKEKFQELVESNEKLEEERDHIQTVLSDTQAKVQRLESQFEHFDERENSFTNGPGGTKEKSKLSPPKHGYTTPLRRNSICMELKERLDESKHLPSPLCEKMEISKDFSSFLRPVALPPYMSAWELDVTNGSVPDYSLELLKSRRGSGVYEVDMEKKILGLKNMEKDALHREIIKLYRLNVELAEKCHRAEVREEELQEMVTQANKKVDTDKHNIHHLEENLQTSRLAREVDLKDLWRIVHVDNEKEYLDSQSDSSELGSSDYLKHQITQEIETLKNRLHKREAALGALSCTRGKVTFAKCQEPVSGSPLVDALAIDFPANKKKHQNRKPCRDITPCKDCQRSNKRHLSVCSKSVPLMRRNSRIHDIRQHLNVSSSSSTSGIGDLEYTNSSVMKVSNKRIPKINFIDEEDSESQTSQSVESNSTDNESSVKAGKENVKAAMDETKMDSLNPLGHVSTEGQVLRRPSYTTAISNETSSVEEVHIPRSRSYSFQTAIEQGQISPTGPPQMTSTSSVGDTTPENESTETSWNSAPSRPRFSSTPLPESKPPVKSVVFHPHTVKPYNVNNTKNVADNQIHKPSELSITDKGDVNVNGETDSNIEELREFQDKEPSKSISMSLQAELIKTGHCKENKSLCSSNHLSILLEEDTHGTPDTSGQSSPALSASGIKPAAQHISSFLGSSGALGSAEFWTLSRSSNTRQTDSGHSSSLTNSGSFLQKESDISEKSKSCLGSTETDGYKRTNSRPVSPKASAVSLSPRMLPSSQSIKIQNPSTPPKLSALQLRNTLLSPKSQSLPTSPKISSVKLTNPSSNISHSAPCTPPRTSVSGLLSSPSKVNLSPVSNLSKHLSSNSVDDCHNVSSPDAYRQVLIIPSPESPREPVSSPSDCVVSVNSVVSMNSVVSSKPVISSAKLFKTTSADAVSKSESAKCGEIPVIETISHSKSKSLSKSSIMQKSPETAKHNGLTVNKIVSPSKAKTLSKSSLLQKSPETTIDDEIPVIESVSPSKTTDLSKPPSVQKTADSTSEDNRERSSTAKEGDSEILIDLTTSLNCMTLDSPPKTNADQSLIGNDEKDKSIQNDEKEKSRQNGEIKVLVHEQQKPMQKGEVKELLHEMEKSIQNREIKVLVDEKLEKLSAASSEQSKSEPPTAEEASIKVLMQEPINKISGIEQTTSSSLKGGDAGRLREPLQNIQDMVKNSPPPSASMSVVSSSLDSRLSSINSTSSTSSETMAALPNNSNKPRRQQQMIIEDGDDSLLSRDDQKSESSLSKLRETHLAKRRDQQHRIRMPQLSELAERDGAVVQNGHGEGEEKLEVVQPPPPNDDSVMPSIPNEFLSKLGLTQDGPGSDELSDQEIESKFTSLSLAFKTDSQTLEKRLEIQERSRDIAEQNVDKELQALRSGLTTLNQICTDPQVREVLTKIQNHIDVLEKSTARVSSRAEVLGAIQQERRMSKAVDIMVHHVENLRRVHEREHAELEEAKKLLQDSRSLGPTTVDVTGNERMLSRRSASVCPNNILPGQTTLKALGSVVALGTAEILPKASRRRVSEIALPKVLGGAGAPNLHLSASMDSSMSPERSPSPLRLENSIEEDEDARSRFQAAVASTAVKSTVANTLRRASLERQNPVQQSPTSTPDISRDNSQDKALDAQEKEKQKNLEEEAYKKGYEQGMRASLGQDLSGLREQQNQINHSLGDIMDSIDNNTEEPKSLKEILLERADSLVPKVKLSGRRIRMTFGCFFIVMAIISVIVSLFPVGSASLVGFRHYGRPPL